MASYLNLQSEIINTIRIHKRRLFGSILSPIFELEYQKLQIAHLGIIIQIPEPSVIQGIQNLDNDVFSYIYQKYFPKIEKYILNAKGDTHDAKDLFQETILDIIDKAKRDKLKILSSFDNYIFKIASNKWKKNFKKIIEYKSKPIDENNITDKLHPLLKDSLEETENFETISEWLNELSDTCKKLIDDFYYKKENWDVIAQSLGYSNAKSARTQKYKCMESLRVRLDAKTYHVF